VVIVTGSTHRIQGSPKNWHTFLYASNFAFTSSNIYRFSNSFHFLNHTSSVSLHYLVKRQCLKSNNWKQDDFCNNTF